MSGISWRDLTPHRALAFAAAALALSAAAVGGADGRIDAAAVGRARGGMGERIAAALASEIEHEEDHVTALELAQWIRERKPGLRVLDVRTDSEYAELHIPSAEQVSLGRLATLEPRRDETLVLYSEGGAHAAQGWVLLRARGHERVYFLKGGLLDWMDEVMNPVIAPSTGRPAVDSATARVAALSRYFGGVPRVGATPMLPATSAAAAVARVRRRGC